MISAGKNAKVSRCEVPLMVVADPKDAQAMRVVNELNALGVTTYVLPEGGAPKLQTGRAVALWDGAREGRRKFRMLAAARSEDAMEFPWWAHGMPWGVKIVREMTDAGVRSCANQIRADFFKRFDGQIDANKFPWGEPRKNEKGPVQIVMPVDANEIIQRLNAGPDFSAAIAHDALRAELPAGSKISWIRVPEPMLGERAGIERVCNALATFETACAKLVEKMGDEVAPQILAGVEIRDSRLLDIYLHPRVDRFSVRRPDLHWTVDRKLAASENDEMPGGFPDACHIDASYGMNEAEWTECFRFLGEAGPIFFVVSDVWSKCYIPVTQWFVEYLNAHGVSALFATTGDLVDCTIDEGGVTFQGAKIGTIWRQFPIFETVGKLADLVVAAHEGRVRMIPEFAHFGNKAWFALYRRYRTFFRSELGEHDALLEGVLPDSWLVTGIHSFPAHVGSVYIPSLEELMDLDEERRDQIVLKVAGANERSARSYGVLMGHGLKLDVWREWISERLAHHNPFIIQLKFATGIQHVPVTNLRERRAELFRCRALLRPWIVNGKIVSAEVCLVPSSTERVHGMVDMALAPLRLE